MIRHGIELNDSTSRIVSTDGLSLVSQHKHPVLGRSGSVHTRCPRDHWSPCVRVKMLRLIALLCQRHTPARTQPYCGTRCYRHWQAVNSSIQLKISNTR
ncbi:hypothetical protein EI94DRAFT_1038580 [Lactarius quietus]|nr:hypothetical protein EI94DRAFT_1038580 [Lactarius quietus]